MVIHRLILAYRTIHGDVSQPQREVTLKRFRNGQCNVLVATDVAARGLDIPNVDLVIQIQPPQETESYIHRSGRTARAGTEGKCITLYNPGELRQIREIEYRAGIKFSKIGLPKPEDIIKQSVQSINDSLGEVDEEVLNLFKESATRLILDKGALKAVSTALAYLSGAAKSLEKRSLITGDNGLVTFKLTAENPFYTKQYVHDILQRIIPRDAGYRYGDVHTTSDKLGAVFDIPTEFASHFMENHKRDHEVEHHRYYSIETATELPEISQRTFRNNDRYSRNNKHEGRRGWSEGRQNRRGNSRSNSKYYSENDSGFSADEGDTGFFNRKPKSFKMRSSRFS